MTERPPYMAIGLSTIATGVAERRHIRHNLETIEEAIHAAISIISINAPVRVVALAEGALTGFTDEIFDVPHVAAAREMFIDLPGEETEARGKLAKHYDTYIIGQCKARWPEVMTDRFFNMLFVIDRQGKLVHKAAKNHIWCRERSCRPHDIYDGWVEIFGDGPEAFFPVLKTDDIGNIGTICCSDGEYPEAVRALAFGGAEGIHRPSEAMPMTASSYPGGGSWMVQNRAHAEFNSAYMLCPNIGPVYLSPGSRFPVDIAGGNSHIVDYRGNDASYSAGGANTMVAAMIDIEALRQFRMSNLNSNWLKDLRTELFARMHEKPIHPRNLWLKDDPMRHAAADEIYRDNIRRLVDRGTWTLPHHETPGARYTPADPEDTDNRAEAKALWRAWHNS